MIDFICSNWWIWLIAIAAIGVVSYFIYIFFKMPTNEQLKKVKEWLLWAVAEAEKELGSGTGQLKLRYVYDMFIVKFPSLAKIISFKTFSHMVDEVLDEFKKLLNKNDKMKKYIEGEK